VARHPDAGRGARREVPAHQALGAQAAQAGAQRALPVLSGSKPDQWANGCKASLGIKV
jgi:hypothetical protein